MDVYFEYLLELKKKLEKLSICFMKHSYFQRNAELEIKVIDWIESVLGERPTTSYEEFIRDGRIISR